ncbi:MAG: DoxX family protein [OCS116 cluster bacterium]|nr:DoxX family protein [OCS116 cluster bacterium]
MSTITSYIGENWWGISLWTVQIFLAFMFSYAGFMKLTKSAQGLSDIGWHWATTLPLGFIRLLAVMELLAAIGVILPTLTGIMPYMGNFAAIGMILVQVAAIILHAKRKETKATIVLNLILLAGAIFIALKL